MKKKNTPLPVKVKDRKTGKHKRAKSEHLEHGNRVAGDAENIENHMIAKFGPEGSSSITSDAVGRAHTLFRQGEKAARIKNNRKIAKAKKGYAQGGLAKKRYI
ncbi:MAG: hypothetical protein HOE83_17095 [Alphaproteobacteria bacterium]|jgi:hypothetical protein|nr:hypothetical protein [Alphaproteobacteria bacterium]